MEDKLINNLDELNVEQTSHLLEKDINIEIDKKAIARIKASVYKKVGTNKKPSVLSRKLIASAAAVILIFCTMFAVGFDNVAAAVKQVIEYIPGFGRAPENNSRVPMDASRSILEVKVMKEPVFIEVKGEEVQIYSSWLTVYKDQAIVTTILRYPQSMELDGEIALEYNGVKIYRDSELPDFTPLEDKKKNKEVTYTYTIRDLKIPINALTFKTDKSKVEIAYKKSEDLNYKSISQNFNGIILSTIPLNQDRTKFILFSTYEKDMEGVMFISSLIVDRQIRAIDEAGNEHEIKRSTSQGSEYYVDGDVKGKIVSLKFNKLYQGFTFKNNKSLQGVKFKTPQVGEKVNINSSLDNSLCSIKLKTVERVAVTSKDPENLMFTYEMKSKIPGLDISHMALYVEKTGGAMAGTVFEKYKEGDCYIVKYGVLADENAAVNTVTIVPFGSFQWDTLLLDKECILKFN